MHCIADTERLASEGIITTEQAREIERRGREAMVALAISTILCFGIVAATAGLILWLADAASVALFGALFVVGGLAILSKAGELYRMFGHAAVLIGTGMLLGGGSAELLQRFEGDGAWGILGMGFVVAAVAGARLLRDGAPARFVTGAVVVMGLAMHLGGAGVVLATHDASGWLVSLFYLYAACAIAGVGWLIDVRFITALAILPFAQMLDTGTFYLHAVYAFYSPEATLSILQMAVLVALCVRAHTRWAERHARHARVLAMMGFITANLCALVGSLWGDVVGESLWGPGAVPAPGQSWEELRALREVFPESTITIGPEAFTVAWALALVAVVVASAVRANRGLFNAALSFAGIHAYTQLFESLGDEPLAYVVGGLGAIPVAWGIWRLNGWIALRGRPG